MITLACKCAASRPFTGTPEDSKAAYDAGWMLGKNGPLCPACAGREMDRHERTVIRRIQEERERMRADGWP